MAILSLNIDFGGGLELNGRIKSHFLLKFLLPN
jgi:hypothetical protein